MIHSRTALLLVAALVVGPLSSAATDDVVSLGEDLELRKLVDGVWRGRLTRRDREDVDLSAPAPQVAARMRARLNEMRKRYRRIDVESRADLSAEDLEKLEALGYAEP